MSRERWGTFSVKDHLLPNAFVADVLLYNMLAIPFPPDKKEEKRWIKEKWHPEILDEKREILKKAQLLIDVKKKDEANVKMKQYRKEIFPFRLALSKTTNELHLR